MSTELRDGVWGYIDDRVQTQPESDRDVWEPLAQLLDPTQFRPKLADDVEIKEFKLRWGNDYAMVANPRDLIHLSLEPHQVEMIRLMDGTRTVKEIVLERFQESGDMELSGLIDLVETLYVANFLERRYVDVDEAVARALHPESVVRQKLRRFASELTIEWKDAHRLVQFFYKRVMRWFFHRWLALPVAGVAIFGVVAFALAARSGQFSLSGSSLAIGAIILLVLDYLSTFIHELAHASVIVHHRRKIKSAGFQIYFGSPAFFVDSSDGLMLEPRERVKQAFAGPYGEIVMAGICAIFAWAFPGAPISETLYRFAVMAYFIVFLNLIPLLELDGYWILSDVIEMPDLRPRSIAFLRHDLWRKLRSRAHLTRQELGLGLYGVLGIAFTLFTFYTAYFFWKQIFGGFVTRLWDGGLAGRIILLVLALLVGAPVIRGLINLLRSIGRRVRAIARQILFRLETKWRIEAAELIDKLPIFEDLPGDVLSDLAGRVRLRSVARGQPIVRQGERATGFYVIRSGSLEVVEENPETGEDRSLRSLGRGEAFGELGLVEGAPRTATVRALEESQVFEVDKGTFERLLKDMAHVPTFAPTLQEVAELRELPSFSHLEPDELSELLALGEWMNFGPGEVIVEQGEPGEDFYAVRSGKLEVVENGEVVRTLGAGSYFGEVALLLDSPRTATVASLTPVRAFRLGREGFDRFLGWAFKRGTLNPQMPQDRTMHH